MSSISLVKNSPTNAIKISAVNLNLASDKSEKINISLLSGCCNEHCVTIKQNVIQAGRWVYNVNLFKKIRGARGFRDTLFFTCFCKFYLFLFLILRECTLLKRHWQTSGIFIELASSTIGLQAKRVLGHRAKLGQHPYSRKHSGHKAIKETEEPF